MGNGKFSSSALNGFKFAQSLEWIEANGLGGYASSTVSGAHSRKYHGLLVAAMRPPVDRRVLLSKLDETIVVDSKRVELGSNQYPDAVHPDGFQYLKSFSRDLFPEFIYEVGNVTLKKTVTVVHGENTTLIIYEVLSADQVFQLELLPLMSARDFHNICHANDSIAWDYQFSEGLFRTKNYHDSPEVFISIPGSSFTPKHDWYLNVELDIERERGLDFQEDLFSHGKFTVDLKKGDTIGIIVSAEDPRGKDPLKLFKNEKKRKESILSPYKNKDANLKRLVLAADQFIVKRGEDLRTIVAGYHWFNDWGRDTMIALPGLCLVTGRFDDAKKILRAFKGYVSQGMLPNRFPDHGEVPEYNTVDATLWYFNAIYKYHQYTNDKALVDELLPVLKDIIEWHDKGTRYNIRVDSDGLLRSGEEGVQLTWMDAKVDDWVVTPRKGKPVEINALWYNALSVMEELLTISLNKDEAATYKKRAAVVKKSFNSCFWDDERKCLYDFVDGDDRNTDVRPNQIYAASLPFPVLSKEKAKGVLGIVTDKLLTPRGLRSLSPDNNEYKPVYIGDRWQRDGAYHQGTVWSFLLGPYVDALVTIEGEKGKKKAKEILAAFLEHLDEAGVGSISEIFDAEPPHHPRGCIAQAWGVGEALRVVMEYGLMEK
jgi:predicted glycogen debranching enzyme